MKETNCLNDVLIESVGGIITVENLKSIRCNCGLFMFKKPYLNNNTIITQTRLSKTGSKKNKPITRYIKCSISICDLCYRIFIEQHHVKKPRKTND